MLERIGGENKILLKKIKETILNDELAKDIKRIFLFGSMVDKENTLLSDLDIAVEFINLNEKEAVRFRLRILANSPERIDVQVLNTLP